MSLSPLVSHANQKPLLASWGLENWFLGREAYAEPAQGSIELAKQRRRN
jgi:hypothetical protein